MKSEHSDPAARLESVVPEFMRERTVRDRSTRDAERQLRAAQNLAEHELIKHELAVLDVRAYHPYLPIEFLIDVTIRHPAPVNKSDVFPGLAAAGGEKDKFDRYPCSRGKQCTPCAIETFGRMGDLFHNFLTLLQNMARKRDAVLGLPKGNYVSKWLPQINAVLNRALAKQLFDAMFASQPSSQTVVPPASFIAPEDQHRADSFYGQGTFPVDAWRAMFRQQASVIETVTPHLATQLFSDSLRSQHDSPLPAGASQSAEAVAPVASVASAGPSSSPPVPDSPPPVPVPASPVTPCTPRTPVNVTRSQSRRTPVTPVSHQLDKWFTPKASTD